jgi:uncharacterized protein (DUF3820 family)
MMGIPENITARKAAEDINGFMDMALNDVPSGSARVFFKTIAEHIPSRYLPRSPASPLLPMSENDSKRFEKTLFPYGKHCGTKISDVPLDYLFWLDEQDDFRHTLRRYLLSDRVQREQKQSEEDDE